MADRGIKFAKNGKTINSTNPDDYNFWTKYPPLNLLEKKTVTITSTSTTFSGTKEVSHDYDFIPMVLGTVKKTSNDNRYFMPASYFSSISCDREFFEIVTFNFAVFDSKVEIYWNASCAIQGYEEGPMFDEEFTIELYFYLRELGKKFP
jgi:hypothetical protein